MTSCPTASDGGRIGPTDYPDNPMELDNYALIYADEQPVQVPMYELDSMANRMPMRSTHGSLDTSNGPRVYQTTRLSRHHHMPLLHQQLQYVCGCRCSDTTRIGRCSDRCGCR